MKLAIVDYIRRMRCLVVLAADLRAPAIHLHMSGRNSIKDSSQINDFRALVMLSGITRLLTLEPYCTEILYAQA